MENVVVFVHGIGKKNQSLRKIENDLFSCCIGCAFESNENEFLCTGGNIAIEWESSAYYLRYLSSREQVNRKIRIGEFLMRFGFYRMWKFIQV